MQKKNQQLIPLAIATKGEKTNTNSFLFNTSTHAKLPSILQNSYLFNPSSISLDQRRIIKNEQALKESYSMQAGNLQSILTSAIHKHSYSEFDTTINNSPFAKFSEFATQKFTLPYWNSQKNSDVSHVSYCGKETPETISISLPSIRTQNSGSLEPINMQTGKKSIPQTQIAPPKEKCFDALAKDPTCRNLLGGNAYKRRNVYKSVVRHMFSYIRKNREEIINLLQGLGYNKIEIEHAFFTVSCYNGEQNNTGNVENSQSIIKRIVSTISIYTYILRESLKSMVNKWDEGKLGKVAKSNLQTYRYVAMKLYEETKSITKSNQLFLLDKI